VGIQCVDCVKEQSRTSRSARTVLGGPAGGNRPVVTRSILASCVVIYLLQLVQGRSFTLNWSFLPVFARSEPWRFLTAAFLHLDSMPMHLLLNMLGLWLVGPYLELLLGPARFLGIYLLSAVGGSVGTFLLADPETDAWLTSVVGASGAIFGLWGALIVVQRHLRRDSNGITGVIVINGILGFVVPGIAWQAHLGGLLTGALAALVIVLVPADRRRTLHPVGLIGIAVLLLGLTIVKMALVPAWALPV
jgi:membrane associated rhomboid family serine protease